MNESAAAEILTDIITGTLGRNQIAKKHRVSGSTVSAIAAAHNLTFPNPAPYEAIRTRQQIAEKKREEREDQLVDQLLALPTTRRRDGRPTRAYNRISYALYNLHRHHL